MQRSKEENRKGVRFADLCFGARTTENVVNVLRQRVNAFQTANTSYQLLKSRGTRRENARGENKRGTGGTKRKARDPPPREQEEKADQKEDGAATTGGTKRKTQKRSPPENTTHNTRVSVRWTLIILVAATECQNELIKLSTKKGTGGQAREEEPPTQEREEYVQNRQASIRFANRK